MKVAFYRLQLFKSSETFVSAQALNIPHAETLLVGRKLFGLPTPGLPYWYPAGMSGLQVGLFLASAAPNEFLPELRKFAPKLIHAHFSVDGLYALPLARKLDVPLITTLHGFDVTSSRQAFLMSARPPLVRYALLQDRLKKAGAKFICVSQFIRDRALRAGFPENRLIVHYIGIDLTLFSPLATASPPRLVHVARLTEKKGTEYLLGAFARLRKRHGEVTLDIVGDGPLRTPLEAQSSALGLQDSVRFHGAQPHTKVRELLRGATAFVLPSVTAASGDAEGLGQVLLEASASGLPLVGTRHGGIPEAVVDGQTGLLVAERNVDELADALNTLLSDDARRVEMGRQAQRFASEHFDIRKQGESLRQIYQEVAG